MRRRRPEPNREEQDEESAVSLVAVESSSPEESEEEEGEMGTVPEIGDGGSKSDSKCPSVPVATPPQLFQSLNASPPLPPSRSASSLPPPAEINRMKSKSPLSGATPPSSPAPSGVNSSGSSNNSGEPNAPPPPPRRAQTSKPLPALPRSSTALVKWKVAKSDNEFEKLYLHTCGVRIVTACQRFKFYFGQKDF